MANAATMLVKRGLATFGIGIHRLNPKTDEVGFANGYSYSVRSAVEHNSVTRTDELYGDRKFVEAHLSADRLGFYEELVALINAKGITLNGKSIADVGCGTGHLLLLIQKRFKPLSLTGFDFSENAVRIARETVPDASFHCGDINNPGNTTFDLVFCTEVLEHLLAPTQALRSIIRMTNVGGTVVVTVPDGRQDTFAGHINFWSPESWAVFVNEAGIGCAVEVGTVEAGRTNVALLHRVPEEQNEIIPE